MRSALAAIVLAPVLAAVACVPVSEIVQRDHVQTITIQTEPVGARVWQRIDGDAVELGQAPIVLQGGYSVLEQRTDKGSCALAGAGEGLSLGEDVGGKAGAVVGLIGLVAGAAAGAAACHQADGPIETRGGRLELVATKAGYLPVRHVVYLPRDSPVLTLRLIPDPNAPPAPEPGHTAADAPAPPAAPAREPARISAAGPAPAGTPVLRPGLAIYPIQIEATGAEVEAGLADRLTDHLATALDRAGFAGPEPGADAALLIDTRMLAVGELCILSATLYRAEDRRSLRVASARGDCDARALDAAIDRLTAQLSPNTRAVVVAP